eukprot:SAG22_NODE_66_length_22936_cov_626.714279_12_plen_235_part_00
MISKLEDTLGQQQHDCLACSIRQVEIRARAAGDSNKETLRAKRNYAELLGGPCWALPCCGEYCKLCVLSIHDDIVSATKAFVLQWCARLTSGCVHESAKPKVTVVTFAVVGQSSCSSKWPWQKPSAKSNPEMAFATRETLACLPCSNYLSRANMPRRPYCPCHPQISSRSVFATRVLTDGCICSLEQLLAAKSSEGDGLIREPMFRDELLDSLEQKLEVRLVALFPATLVCLLW